MKIRNLKLRGAIGIKKGLGVDEIEIDFTQFQPGLIALTGRNGSGKTTVMENLHPYRQMVSRDGSLQSHFYLKDSYRVLDFESNGKTYQSSILIDALTGASEAYLFENPGLPDMQPLNDGKLTTYDTEIEKLLGTPELFFNSVFSGQKSKGIAELKPADRRKLFYELLNLNVYETYLERAKAELKKEEIKLAQTEAKINLLTAQSKSIEVLETTQSELNSQKAETIKTITRIESEISEVQTKLQKLEVEKKLSEEKKLRNTEHEKKIASILIEIQQCENDHNAKVLKLNSDVEENTKLLNHNLKLSTEEAETTINTKLEQIKELTGLIDNGKNSLMTLQKKYSLYKDEHSKRIEEISESEKNLVSIENEANLLKQQTTSQKAEIDKIEKSILILVRVPCTEELGSNCPFVENAYSDKSTLDSKIESLNNLNKRLTEKKTEFDKTKSEIEIIKTKLINANTEKELHFYQQIDLKTKTLKGQENELKELNKTDWQKLKDELKQASNNVTLYQSKIESLLSVIEEAKENYLKEVEKLGAEVNELYSKIDANLDSKISRIENEINCLNDEKEELQQQLKEQKELSSSLDKQITEIEKEIEQEKINMNTITKLQQEKRNIEAEILDWTFLSKAFDKTGIPVLKLENSGIEITSIANELLSLFENKFRIVFETTSLTKDKKKLKETFDINIVEEDGVCEIGNKSGGQQVWLETAIQLAISLVVRKQGRNIETSFLDEKDGALDLDNAYNYIEMLRKAHQMSGVNNTFIITHRPELLDLIPQQVKLTDGYLQILN